MINEHKPTVELNNNNSSSSHNNSNINSNNNSNNNKNSNNNHAEWKIQLAMQNIHKKKPLRNLHYIHKK